MSGRARGISLHSAIPFFSRIFVIVEAAEDPQNQCLVRVIGGPQDVARDGRVCNVEMCLCLMDAGCSQTRNIRDNGAESYRPTQRRTYRAGNFVPNVQIG